MYVVEVVLVVVVVGIPIQGKYIHMYIYFTTTTNVYTIELDVCMYVQCCNAYNGKFYACPSMSL